MATFHGSGRLEALPEILQRYCVPVSLHDLIRPGSTHIHTTPEWYPRNTWVIAYKYKTFGRILGRWQNRKSHRPRESSYMLDFRTHRQLEVICEQRIIQWEAICAQDPNVKQRCYDQYKAIRRQLYDKRKASQQLVKKPNSMVTVVGVPPPDRLPGGWGPNAVTPKVQPICLEDSGEQSYVANVKVAILPRYYGIELTSAVSAEFRRRF
ncbi:hypothetical protein C8Q70DRAFT_930109 [Cubamyces menziesii]|nr:hypothetical protein C8Q70DRAFT_930109 [Cubamyces menziesii]